MDAVSQAPIAVETRNGFAHASVTGNILGMRIAQESPLRTQPWLWLLKAVSVGFFPSALITLYFCPKEFLVLATSGLVGAIFAVVIWGGYECTVDWIDKHPASFSPIQAALFILGKWTVVYLILVGVSVALVRVLLGINCVQDRLSAFITIFLGFVISSLVVSTRSISQMIATTRSLEQARARAGFLAMKAQLSPHTLFNALNTIAALIPEDPRAAEEAVMRLSALLRKILTALEKERWSLAEEFELIRDLLGIQFARFGKRLAFELVIPPSEEDRQIPPLLLLPLVENSLKHGFASKVDPCHLVITAGNGWIKIQDDGVGRDQKAAEGVGTSTVRQRVEAMGGWLEWPPCEQGCVVEVHLCR